METSQRYWTRPFLRWRYPVHELLQSHRCSVYAVWIWCITSDDVPLLLQLSCKRASSVVDVWHRQMGRTYYSSYLGNCIFKVPKNGVSHYSSILPPINSFGFLAKFYQLLQVFRAVKGSHSPTHLGAAPKPWRSRKYSFYQNLFSKICDGPFCMQSFRLWKPDSRTRRRKGMKR